MVPQWMPKTSLKYKRMSEGMELMRNVSRGTLSTTSGLAQRAVNSTPAKSKLQQA